MRSNHTVSFPHQDADAAEHLAYDSATQQIFIASAETASIQVMMQTNKTPLSLLVERIGAQ